MKKLLTLLLVALTALSLIAFTACEASETPPDTPSDVPKQDQTITEKDWSEMISAASFENYTLTQAAIYSAGAGFEEDTLVTSVVKFTKDKVEIKFTIGDVTNVIVYDGEMAKEQKDSYEKIFISLLENPKDYEYDATEKAYKNSKTITVEDTMHYPAEDDRPAFDLKMKIVMNNGKATISANGKLLTFVCDYTQTTETPNGTSFLSTEMSWTFSNYGTTTITEAPNVTE